LVRIRGIVGSPDDCDDKPTIGVPDKMSDEPVVIAHARGGGEEHPQHPGRSVGLVDQPAVALADSAGAA